MVTKIQLVVSKRTTEYFCFCNGYRIWKCHIKQPVGVLVLRNLNNTVVQKGKKIKKVCVYISPCFFGLKLQHKSDLSSNFAMARKWHLEKPLLAKNYYFVLVNLSTVRIAEVHESYNRLSRAFCNNSRSYASKHEQKALYILNCPM